VNSDSEELKGISTSASAYSATHVVLGRIGAPWGIKGWVKLFSFTDPPANLLDYPGFLIATERGLQKLEFAEVRPQGKSFVGHIKGCDVREQTGEYTGCELLISKSQLPGLETGYYWHQLEGLRVITQQGEVLGVVHHLMETGANDVLVIRGDTASVDQTERLLPYLMGQVVKEIDLAQGLIIVDWQLAWDQD